MNLNKILAVVLFAFVPCTANAQVVISEIMYDLEGSDSGREWIEVFNTGAALDMSTWRVVEGETNHTIKEVLGGTQLPAGGYAIIADNTAKFLEDWPGFSGQLFDSAFSLSNTGESLGLRDQDLIDRDTVSYTGDMGAAGDGKSLTRSSVNSNAFSAASPTPGSGSLVAQGSVAQTVEEESPTPATTEVIVAASQSIPVTPQIFAYAGKDKVVLVGADSIFAGKALNKDGEPLSGNIRYVWNFGDGSTEEGQTVMHHFTHAGTYSVLLQVASGMHAGSHRITVVAKVPQFALFREEGALVLQNKSQFDLDISFFHIRSNGVLFSIPEGTLLMKGNEIVFDSAVTRLPADGPYALLFPNGVVVEAPVETIAMAAPAPQAFTARPLSISAPVSRGPSVVETPIENAPEENGVAPVAAVSAQTAAAAGAFPGWAWVLGLFGIVGVGALGVYLAAASEEEEWRTVDKEADLR